jgi:hypothetical protein
MAYNYFPTNYQPYYQQNNQQNSIIWVSGEAGAKAYMVAPNQTVVLFDSEAQTIYLKSADASGMPSIKILDYDIRNGAPQKADILPQNDFATKDEVVALRKEINALKAKLEPQRKGKVSER